MIFELKGRRVKKRKAVGINLMSQDGKNRGPEYGRPSIYRLPVVKGVCWTPLYQWLESCELLHGYESKIWCPDGSRKHSVDLWMFPQIWWYRCWHIPTYHYTFLPGWWFGTDCTLWCGVSHFQLYADFMCSTGQPWASGQCSVVSGRLATHSLLHKGIKLLVLRHPQISLAFGILRLWPSEVPEHCHALWSCGPSVAMGSAWLDRLVVAQLWPRHMSAPDQTVGCDPLGSPQRTVSYGLAFQHRSLTTPKTGDVVSTSRAGGKVEKWWFGTFYIFPYIFGF